MLSELFAKRYGAVIPPEVIAGFPVKEAFDVFCKALEHSQPQVRLAAAQGMNMIVDELEHPESCRNGLSPGGLGGTTSRSRKDPQRSRAP